MNPGIRVLVLVLVPVLLMAAAWQGGNVLTMRKELAMLEKTQTRMIADNQKIAADIRLGSSRHKVYRIATEQGLQPITPERRLYIKIEGEAQGDGL